MNIEALKWASLDPSRYRMFKQIWLVGAELVGI